jgi:hypothetical protein
MWKRILLTLAICFVLTLSMSAQTVSSTPDRNTPVQVTQGFVDDATKAFALVVELRDALQKEQMASGASAVTKAALQAQIDALNGLIAIKDRKDAAYESLLTLRDKAFEMYDRIIKIQADMLDRLTAQLNKPQSAWKKFVRMVEKIVVFAAGAAIGRGI